MNVKNKYSICTIIAKNYISFARTLCSSFLQHHPEGNCYVLFVDNIEGYVDPEKEQFNIIKTDDLAISNLNEFRFKYNIIELSTALKPYLLNHLLDSKSIDKILYIDPDILITNRLDNLYESLDDHDYIITPHLDKDYPDDGLLPNDSTIMKHGIFNLGFIGVRKCANTSQFLYWWQHKLYDKCLMDTANGYYVDQKFIDLAITLFKNYKILSEVGYNVAFWNLHSRAISSTNNEWYCNQEKLYFYHFSNFRPEMPNMISSHQTRYKLEDNPCLSLLYSNYCNMLLKNGYLTSNNWPYSYNYFSNGEEINDLMRKVYRRSLLKRKVFKDPFNISEYSTSYRALVSFLRLYDSCVNKLLKVYRKYLKKIVKKILLY